MPMETMAEDEVRPSMIRPPGACCPDVATFLRKIQTDEVRPASDFASVFSSWNDLMTCPMNELLARGIPSKTAALIRDWRNRYNNGELPEYYDLTAERQYWRSFKPLLVLDRMRVPELPEKYRPHQLGEDSRAVPDYAAINVMPPWAVKEEERLKEKLGMEFK